MELSPGPATGHGERAAKLSFLSNPPHNHYVGGVDIGGLT
jgi:hypothetical protein